MQLFCKKSLERFHLARLGTDILLPVFILLFELTSLVGGIG